MPAEIAGIASVLWATGFKPDYRWLDVPVLDRKGMLRHDGGVLDAVIPAGRDRRWAAGAAGSTGAPARSASSSAVGS